MKKLISGILMAIVMLGFSSCRSDYDPLADGNYRLQREKVKNVMKTVSLNFGGDFITESEEPLLRAEDGDTYIAIDVWRTDNAVTDSDPEPYAYGLFKNKEYGELTIDVETGYSYNFEATILIDGDDTVFVNESRYEDPFKIIDGTSKNFTTAASSYDSKYLDGFQYTSAFDLKDRKHFCQLQYGTAYVDTKGYYSPRQAYLSYPRVKRYYGTCTSFNPTEQNEVNIPMAYKSFGLRIELESLPGGELKISDVSNTDSSKCLVFPNDLRLKNEEGLDSWEGFYSMYNLEADSETFTLEFIWHKGGSVNDSFKRDVTIKANTKKILKLKIEGTPTYMDKGNIKLVVEEENLSEEEEPIDYNFDNPES